MRFDYPKICNELLKGLPLKQKEVILRRFGLTKRTEFNLKDRETLESIGRDFDITRERVRQIERDGLLSLKPKLNSLQKVFQYFKEHLKKTGDLRKEELLLADLGGDKHKSHIFFLLTLGKDFERFSETQDFYSLWTVNQKSLKKAEEFISAFYQHLNSAKKPLRLSDFKPKINVSPKILEHYLAASKAIQKNQEGLFGLNDWPEINPKSVKDKALLVFRKNKQPLHFQEVAKLIGPDALPQTVHNELIRHPQFVLVGRGTYALKEWGYEHGHVKDIIAQILAKEGRPLSKEEVLEKVLKQRLVKENTVLLNLSNKNHFLRTPEGKYIMIPGVKEA